MDPKFATHAGPALAVRIVSALIFCAIVTALARLTGTTGLGMATGLLSVALLFTVLSFVGLPNDRSCSLFPVFVFLFSETVRRMGVKTSTVRMTRKARE